MRDVGRPGVVFDRFADLSASFALGGNGTRGDGVCGGLPEVEKCGIEVARVGGEGE